MKNESKWYGLEFRKAKFREELRALIKFRGIIVRSVLFASENVGDNYGGRNVHVWHRKDLSLQLPTREEPTLGYLSLVNVCTFSQKIFYSCFTNLSHLHRLEALLLPSRCKSRT